MKRLIMIAFVVLAAAVAVPVRIGNETVRAPVCRIRTCSGDADCHQNTQEENLAPDHRHHLASPRTV
jgi:hypothetical protein